MRIEGLYASCSPSFDPLTDRPFTHPQRYRDILLLPTRLFQLPRSFASFFSPIGFLWCSHTSYLTTLYFPLPRSVSFKDCVIHGVGDGRNLCCGLFSSSSMYLRY